MRINFTANLTASTNAPLVSGDGALQTGINRTSVTDMTVTLAVKTF